jgi:triacylglycerol lipase
MTDVTDPHSDSISAPISGRDNPVVLVHGIWNTAGIFAVLKAHLEREGRVVYALSMTPNNGDAPIEVLAEQVARFIESVLGPRSPFDLVGFSMGGLIGRYYVQHLGGLSRVQRFVTVSAPHQGTLLGFFSHRPGVRQMCPGSPFLQRLNQERYLLNSVQFVSLWTPFDYLILPPWSSLLAVGRAQLLTVSGHNRMIVAPRGLQAITQALSA